MVKYYLAGPMTGLEVFNFPAFEQTAKVLRHKGYDIVSAAEVDFGEDINSRGKTLPYGEYCRADLKVMLDCSAVIFMPGWTLSRGCLMEFNVALAIGMAIFTVNIGSTELKRLH